MSRVSRYVKAPDEAKRYQIDYNDWLDIGEGVFSVTFKVEDNNITNPLVVSGLQIAPAGRSVVFLVSGGAADEAYNVTATLTTTATPPQVKQDVIAFSIREPV